jgi:hypothetical protein
MTNVISGYFQIAILYLLVPGFCFPCSFPQSSIQASVCSHTSMRSKIHRPILVPNFSSAICMRINKTNPPFQVPFSGRVSSPGGKAPSGARMIEREEKPWHHKNPIYQHTTKNPRVSSNSSPTHQPRQDQYHPQHHHPRHPRRHAFYPPNRRRR